MSTSEQIEKLAEEKRVLLEKELDSSIPEMKYYIKEMALLQAKKELGVITAEEEKDIRYLASGFSSEVVGYSYQAGTAGKEFLLKVIELLFKKALGV